jgi:hypothetical protein
LAAAYTGWTFYSRYSARQEATKEAGEAKAREDQNVIDRLGGKKLKILALYASPPAAAAGERVLVCYSVVNATEVSIVPGIEPIKPSLSRCLEAHPNKSATYILKARDASGSEVSQTTSVEIR